MDVEALPDDDHAIVPVACGWAVRELRDVLTDQANVLELALFDNVLLDVPRTTSRLGLYLITRFTDQIRPSVLRQLFGDFVQIGHRVEAEDEPHAVVVPPVQVRRLREVRVTPQADTAKACFPTDLHRA